MTTAAPAPDGAARLTVTKGHGTENDFVLIADRDGTVDLAPSLVVDLADRRTGIGADGVIRLVPSAALAEGARSLAEDPAAHWFMDYRNADGSAAEMCGNGIRVVAAFAERLGVWDGAGELVLGTRAGVRRVRREPAVGQAGWYAVDMGQWSLPGGDGAVAAGHDAEVAVPGLPVARPALRVDVGNPHTVLALSDVAELESVDLREPRVTPTPPGGTNVELVVPMGEQAADATREPVDATGSAAGASGVLRMRVHERGVGETRSCGTGACAAAIAVRAWAGPDAPDQWWVDVPGGRLRVRIDGGRVELAGPAVLVAEISVDRAAIRRGG